MTAFKSTLCNEDSGDPGVTNGLSQEHLRYTEAGVCVFKHSNVKRLLRRKRNSQWLKGELVNLDDRFAFIASAHNSHHVTSERRRGCLTSSCIR